MTTLFISDLHLEADRPAIGRQFLSFLESEARHAEALYILGDLFESWVGDDDPDVHYAAIKTALRRLVDDDVPVYFLHGNRDFMIGDQFAAETGISLLPDPHAVEMYGTSVLLSHGDAMCTDDIEYQQFRTMTRNPEWQAMMLAKPLPERIAYAARARAQSQQHMSSLLADQSGNEIMDVNPAAVANTIAEFDVDVLLHGHTHRPAVHKLKFDDREAIRIVLGDWYEQGSVLRWGADGFSLDSLPRRSA